MGVRETFWPQVKHLPPEEREAELKRIEAHLRARAEKLRQTSGHMIDGNPRPSENAGSVKARRARFIEWVARMIERVFTRRSGCR